jgi:hypothetical protein
MAGKKRPSLTNLTTGTSALTRHVAPKGEAIHDAPARSAAKSSGGSLRYMQTRLSESGWKSLKLLSVEQGKPLQGLVIEALNDLLRKYGKAPVVSGPDSDSK